MPLPARQPGDHGVDADYDHDGTVDSALWRSGNGTWFVEPSSGGPLWERTVGSARVPASAEESDGLRVLAGALSTLAGDLWRAGDQADAMAASQARTTIFDRLAGADPATYRPVLASALMEVVLYGAADQPAALLAAERAVHILQELAGIDDDYPHLSGLTPNTHWEQLATALSYLTQARWNNNRQPAAMTAAQNRVHVLERLAAPDRPPAEQDRFRPVVASALMGVALYGTADPPAALLAAERAVHILEELSGISSGNYDAPAEESLETYIQRAARGVRADPATSDLAEFRAALRGLAELPVATLERLMAQSIDLSSHRLDAWITSFATQRLEWLRGTQRPRAGVGIGGYGWLEDLRRPLEPPATTAELPDEPGPLLRDPNGAGFVHAPSLAHATTAAVLRGGQHAYARDGISPLAIDLRSHRVQLAAWLLDGVRQGQPLGALLGYRVERALHEFAGLARHLPELRRRFPRRVTAVSAEEGVNSSVRTVDVVDGLAVHRAWQLPERDLPERLGVTDTDERGALVTVLDDLAETVDALADALLAEGVHHVVQGNPLRAGATLDAADRGEAPPPELDVARTPRTGLAVTHRLLVVLGREQAQPAGWPVDLDVQARAQAEPRLNAWLATLLPAPARVRYRVEAVGARDGRVVRAECNLAALRISPLDLVALPEHDSDATQSELDLRLMAAAREMPQIGSAAQVRLDLSRDPSWGSEVVSVAELLEVLRCVRAMLELSRPLEARDVALPESSTSEQDADPTIARRTRQAVEALRRARADLDPGVVAERTVRRGLLRAAHLGVTGALSDTAPLRSTADLTAAELDRRQDALDQLDVERAAAGMTQLDHDRARMQVVFGSSFRILPSFPADTVLAEAVDGSRATQGDDPCAAVGWLHRVAKVRRGADRLIGALSYAEALDTGAALTIDVAQLPHTPEERWLGLPFEVDSSGERLPPPGNRLSLLLHAPEGVGQAVAGLAIDEWTEVIPSRTELTGVAFHYDAPGASPPQAILLAVSPDARERWSTELLEATLAEALSLTHLRAVDLEALRPSDPDDMTDIGQLLPAAHLATNVADGDAIATDLTRGSA